MGLTKITIDYDSEKIKAIEKFAEKKGVNIEDTLKETLDKLFLKTVPPAVREYIEG